MLSHNPKQVRIQTHTLSNLDKHKLYNHVVLRLWLLTLIKWLKSTFAIVRTTYIHLLLIMLHIAIVLLNIESMQSTLSAYYRHNIDLIDHPFWLYRLCQTYQPSLSILSKIRSNPIDHNNRPFRLYRPSLSALSTIPIDFNDSINHSYRLATISIDHIDRLFQLYCNNWY